MFSAVLGTLLAFIAVDDFLFYRVRNPANALLAGFGLLFCLANGQVIDGLAGGALGFALIYGAAWAYRSWRGREGIGMGDAKLLGAGGIWTGAQDVPLALFVACACALVASALWPRIFRREKPGGKIPFAPFLCLGISAAWLGLGDAVFPR